jgi:hypothetical protein
LVELAKQYFSLTSAATGSGKKIGRRATTGFREPVFDCFLGPLIQLSWFVAAEVFLEDAFITISSGIAIAEPVCNCG